MHMKYAIYHTQFLTIFVFVLRFYCPVNPLGSCWVWSVYLIPFYWAGLVPQVFKQYCAHSSARNWQLPFLNQPKGRKYFMKTVIDPTWVGPATSWSPVGCASNWLTKVGFFKIYAASNWKDNTSEVNLAGPKSFSVGGYGWMSCLLW